MQNQYSLLYREEEREMNPLCKVCIRNLSTPFHPYLSMDLIFPLSSIWVLALFLGHHWEEEWSRDPGELTLFVQTRNHGPS